MRIAVLALALLGPLMVAARFDERIVKPSAADPAVSRFDDPSIAIADPQLAADAPLAVFLTGSYGKPANVVPLLRVIAGQGYRVIGLSYNDAPAVLQICARDPDPACAEKFRELRSFGAGSFPAQPNPPAEAIVPRLVAALRMLDREAPKAGWGGYLDGAAPRWDRILVSGLSQGAGMAAFIAKRHAVRRVVLFSSPWDFTGADRRPAPWLATPSATPPARWQAAYNARESAVSAILPAYAALKIPPANIRVFRLDLPPGRRAGGPNPYHPIGIHDPRYLADWRTMFGRGGDPAP